MTEQDQTQSAELQETNAQEPVSSYEQNGAQEPAQPAEEQVSQPSAAFDTEVAEPVVETPPASQEDGADATPSSDPISDGIDQSSEAAGESQAA